MLNILANALLIATRLDTRGPSQHDKHRASEQAEARARREQMLFTNVRF